MPFRGEAGIREPGPIILFYLLNYGHLSIAPDITFVTDITVMHVAILFRSQLPTQCLRQRQDWLMRELLPLQQLGYSQRQL